MVPASGLLAWKPVLHKDGTVGRMSADMAVWGTGPHSADGGRRGSPGILGRRASTLGQGDSTEDLPFNAFTVV